MIGLSGSKSLRIKTHLVILIILGISLHVKCDHYLNKFAVHIPGGERIAREVAREGGYTLIGQVGTIEDHYLFEHPHVHRRSAEVSDHHHQHLSSHPQVHWFEQQRLLTRRKRDFMEDGSFRVQRSVDESSLNREKKGTQNIEDLHYNDELFSKMWYYNGGGLNHTDMNVKGAWAKGVTGKNVVITILDDGIERNHDDLKDNYDPFASYDVNGHDPDPMPRYDYTNENRHGTRCAGEVSAKANNTKCVVGVAYDSKIGGVRMLDGDVYDAVEATSLSHNRSHIDIYSASWGPDDDGRVVDGPGALAKKAFIDGVKMGRGGKGSIFVWASGNGGNQKDSCNCDGYTNSIYTLSISSISQHGKKPWYLEECSSTLATTYSSGSYSEKQIVTVDLRNRCTETHTGTSASAPLAAGIVALILEVKPSLTWRDVQYITLMTARPMPDGNWITNGVGRQVSLRYGYGLMDATAMVELAEKWTNVPEQHVCEVHSTVVDANKPKIQIPDEGYEEVLDTDACASQNNAINFLEHVQAKITLKSKRRGDLVIHLTSPMGTRSTILPQRPNDGDRMKGFNGWQFLSVHFWGENPVGHWKLEIEVVKNTRGYIGSSSAGLQSTNDLVEWSLILYGTDGNPVNLVKPTHKPNPDTPPTTEGICHHQCINGCAGPGADQCTACKNYKMETTGMCVETCPNEYYSESFVCKRCNETCETCTYISAKQIMCLKCKPGYLLINGRGTCEEKCDKGYFKETTTTAVPLQQRSDLECTADEISVFLPAKLFSSNRNMTWRDETCSLQNNGTHYVGTISLAECGSTVEIGNDTVTFSNEILVLKADDNDLGTNSEITHGEDFDSVIPVKCVYPRFSDISNSYVPVKQNVRFVEEKFGALDVTMQQFTDAGFESAVGGDEYPRKIPLNDDVFIRIGSNFERSDLRVETDQCIATSKPSPADDKWLPLIESGCPKNGVRLLSSANSSDVRFTFKAFDFRHDSSGFIYLHCQVSICDRTDDTCRVECSTRTRRSADVNRKSHLVSAGPFFVHDEDKTNLDTSLSVPTVFAVIALVVAIAASVLAVIGWTRKVKT